MPNDASITAGKMSNDSQGQTEWKSWLRENSRRFLLCARQWTNSLAEAEDVLQDAFIRYWKGQRHLGGSPDALMITSIRRAAIDHGRSRTRRIERETETYNLSEQTEYFEPGDDGENEEIEVALKQLTHEQREIVVMKIWGNLTFAEIAKQLDIPQNTAASRYRYALEALKKHLKR